MILVFLSFLSADLTWLDIYISMSFLNPCLHSGETRFNLKNWCFWLLNILNSLIKSNHKCVLNRVRSENFQKIISEQQLACQWAWSMNVKLGTFEATLAS